MEKRKLPHVKAGLIQAREVINNIQLVESGTDINAGGKWIPFKEREADTEEKEMYGCDMMLDCKLPDDGQEIIVTYANGYVGTDLFVRDGYECYLENSEIVTQAIAWMPVPEPYKPKLITKPCFVN